MSSAVDVKRALAALERMQAKLDAATRARTEPIAIVGMGCRFPGGANDPDAFWRLLRDGVDAIREVPPDRWDVDALYDSDPASSGKMYARWAGFIDDVDQFDPAFFGISAREANSMDPQQRILLETAWQALENAGIAPERLAGSPAGVFVGACSSDYARFQFADIMAIDAWTGTGSAHSILANRLSYWLDLQGPSMAVDTACSSSLVAVALACQSLRDGDCSTAFAGGVNLMLAPEPTMIFCRAQMMASDGRCKTFDSRADGYVRGEGAGVVILKRLSDARADGDRILAVIRGVAVNQDGRSNGLAAPNLLAQKNVLRKALANARLEPGEVTFIEAHGTGTALGDPIEVEALADVYGVPTAAGAYCRLGSVKTNIGHLEAAAGVAGLIKAVLCMRHREIPPNLHFRRLNPNISLAGTRFTIPNRIEPWEATGPLRAAVSSFGFGGTNAHVIVESPPEGAPTEERPERPLHVLTLSAKSPAALEALSQCYQALDPEGASFPDICYTANTGRARHAQRLAVVAPDLPEAQRRLVAGEMQRGTVEGDEPLRTAFLFTGQGSQRAEMGGELYKTSPVFRESLDACAAILDPLLERPLFLLLNDGARLQRTEFAQPALFAIEWALAQLWMSWGVRPDCLLGHSLGELVAACVAGVFPLDAALRLAVARGSLMQKHSRPGAMAAIFADAADVRPLLGAEAPETAIAAENGPTETVISGPAEQTADVLAAAQARGLRGKALATQTAFHSCLMDPVLAPFGEVAAAITYSPAKISVISNRTGRQAAPNEFSNPTYWVRQIREPVLFGQALDTLAAQRFRALIEIGPQPILLPIQRRAQPDSDAKGLPSLRSGEPEWRRMLDSLAEYHVHGGRVDWDAFDRPYTRRRVSVPTYSFQRSRYWMGERPAQRLSPHLYELTWKEIELPQPAAKAPPRLLILASGSGVGEALAASWVGDARVVASAEEAAEDLASTDAGPLAVVDLSHLDRSLDTNLSGPELVAALGGCADAAVALMAAIVEAGGPSVRLYLVTHGAQQGDVTASPAWGIGRVFAHEHGDCWGGLIDLDRSASDTEAAAHLATILAARLPSDEWRVRDGKIEAARLTRVSGPPSKAVARFDAEAAYLVTGGFGALGLLAAEWLVGAGSRKILLVGRRPPGAEAARRIAVMRRAGATVMEQQADLTEPTEVARVLAAVPAPLRGIIHCAGVLDDGVILRQNRERFLNVLAPKAGVAWELHRQTLGTPLDFFVLCSSASGVMGAPGQANYAAANVFLDQLAAYRRSLGLPALSVAWGPWDVGMNAGRRRVEGVQPIRAESGWTMLGPLLDIPISHVVALPVDWSAFGAALPAGARVPLVEDLIPAARPGTPPAALRDELKTVAGDERLLRIKSYLSERIARAVGGGPEFVDDRRNILDLGMDSLMIIEVLNDCRRELDIILYPREIYARPAFGDLVRYLAAEFERAHVAPPASPPSKTAAFPSFSVSAAAPSAPPRKRNPQAVFLLSSPRSGSTLLRVMLAGHPNLFSPPELHLLPFDSLTEWEQALGASYLTQGFQRALMELRSLDAAASEAEVRALASKGRSVQEAYALLQELAAPRILVDKSPSYAVSLETLHRAETLFEAPLYIRLLRHPYAVIESFTRNRMHKLVGMDEADPFDVAEQAWLSTNRNLAHLEKEVGPSRCHTIRYEDLVVDPRATLEALCRFLSIPFDAAVLQPYAQGRMTDGVHSRSLPIGDPTFLSRDSIDPQLADAWRHIELPRPLSPEAVDLAQSLGYETPQEAAAPRHEIDEFFVEARRRRFGVCAWGPKTGPAVVCLHGMLEQGLSWELVAEPLAREGFRVVAPDLRGHGLSDHAGPGAAYHILDFVADVEGVVDAVVDGPFVLVGHSMGAGVAALYAGARPERVSSLILVEPPEPTPATPADLASVLAAQLDYLGKPQQHLALRDVDEAAARLRRAAPAIPVDLARRAARRVTERCEEGVRWRWDPLLRTRAGIAFDAMTLQPEMVQALLARVPAPAYAVFGEGPGRAWPGVTETILGCGHNVHFEAPRELALVILNAQACRKVAY